MVTFDYAEQEGSGQETLNRYVAMPRPCRSNCVRRRFGRMCEHRAKRALHKSLDKACFAARQTISANSGILHTSMRPVRPTCGAA